MSRMVTHIEKSTRCGIIRKNIMMEAKRLTYDRMMLRPKSHLERHDNDI